LVLGENVDEISSRGKEKASGKKRASMIYLTARQGKREVAHKGQERGVDRRHKRNGLARGYAVPHLKEEKIEIRRKGKTFVLAGKKVKARRAHCKALEDHLGGL